MADIVKWFNFDHVDFSKDKGIERFAIYEECQKLAYLMDGFLPESAEKTTGLRKMLEAKDCFVRAYLEKIEKESE